MKHLPLILYVALSIALTTLLADLNPNASAPVRSAHKAQQASSIAAAAGAPEQAKTTSAGRPPAAPVIKHVAQQSVRQRFGQKVSAISSAGRKIVRGVASFY